MRKNESAQQEGTKDDLIFSTEVDTAGMDFSRAHVNSQAYVKKEPPTNENGGSTRLSDHSMPVQALSLEVSSINMEQKETEEFRDVLKELIAKEKDNTMRLEEKILMKMKKKALSRGWQRQSGAKVAPLKLLQSMN